jgi:hypothetical protein
LSTTTYNGWSNYETWAVKLWLDNDEGTYNYWSDRAKEIIRDPRLSEYLTIEQTARQDLADELKREHEENAPEVSGVFSDLLNAALSEVEWSEIAESMLADAKESMLADGETLDEEA